MTKKIIIDPKDIRERFVRASGPGGQNINKVATAVELRFDLKGTRSLSEEIKQRLRIMAGHRLRDDGSIVIESRRFRTQEANRQDVRQKLWRLIERASIMHKIRTPTKPTRASVERRIREKKRWGQVKAGRASKHHTED